MNRDSVDWWGPMSAVITPFDERGAIDAPALRENIDRTLAAGGTGVLVGGCTANSGRSPTRNAAVCSESAPRAPQDGER